jgi:hypothetical protein
MPRFQPSFRPSAASYGEVALPATEEVPAAVRSQAREIVEDAASADMPTSVQDLGIPTGNRDLLLVSPPAGETLEEAHSRLEAREERQQPFYRQRWFLPAAMFGVVWGVFKSR